MPYLEYLGVIEKEVEPFENTDFTKIIKPETLETHDEKGDL